MKIIIISIVAVIVLISCKNQDVERDVILSYSNTVRIYKKDLLPGNSYEIITNPNYKNNLFVNLNYLAKKLFIFDFQNSIFLYSVDLQKFSTIESVYYVNKDSIFITERAGNLLRLINNKGNLINYWLIESNSNSNLKIFERITDSNPLYYNNHSIIATSLDNNYDENQWYNNKVYTKFKLDDKKHLCIRGAGIPFSGVFRKGKQFSDEYPRYIINNKNEIIVAFNVDTNIYVYDENLNLKRTVSCKSKYIRNEEFSEYVKSKVNSNSYIDSMYRVNPTYIRFLYDKNRNIYYRFAVHSNKPYNNDGEVIEYKDKSWSIIVLDKDLNIMNEYLIPKGAYFPGNCAVCKEGLTFSKESSARGKSYWEFDIYKIEINEFNN